MQLIYVNSEQHPKEVYVVKLAKKKISTQIAYVGIENGLVLKADTSEFSREIGPIPVTIRYDDYRKVGGLRLPFRIESKNQHSGKMLIQLEKIDTNVDLPEDAFALKPPASK